MIESPDRVNAVPTWLSAAMGAAHDLEENLADPGQLASITQALVKFAAECRADMVTGASALGHQLAGLVVAKADPPVALWAQNGARGTVLVVEGVLVSGAQISAVARRAHAAGATRVVAAAVVADPAGLELCRRQIDDEVCALRHLVTPG